ncbi:MAG: DUF1016 N-terminal domain-containing protein [Sulfuritalea sp.]|nr:DUF1016 N-terminal domain-containing protein [Sulfuritalea sp.]
MARLTAALRDQFAESARLEAEIRKNLAEQGYGTKVIDRLAVDLREAFPDMKGFSPRNPKYMRAFAATWPDSEVVQRSVAQLTWGHNITATNDKSIDRLSHLADGAAYPAIRPDVATPGVCGVPTEWAIEAFHAISAPPDQRSDNQSLLQLKLAALRDFQLPKLLSGDLAPWNAMYEAATV